jgi:hypothetical protein
MGLSTPNDVLTLMGWNQAVYIDPDGTENWQVLRVTDYEIGARQTPDAPDYVTGRQDRTAFTKGPIEIEGTLSYPLTFETGGNTFNGLQMFTLGAELARNPQNSFGIKSSAGETLQGCKVQTTSLSCNAGEGIQCSSTVWGISTEENMSVGSDDARVLTSDLGVAAGENVDNQFTTVQIPMWDAVKIAGAPDDMLVVGFNIQVDNQLQRNYTMGNQTVYSPWGLNATSISSGQRRITGSVTWQSSDLAQIKAVWGAGIQELVITIKTSSTTSKLITLSKCLWNAQPPRLSTGDRVTIETPFTALGEGLQDFDAMVIADA